MTHEEIVATYSDDALESIIRDLAKIRYVGITRIWANHRLSAARAELRKREIEYNKSLK
jgi:hypothetical protein